MIIPLIITHLTLLYIKKVTVQGFYERNIKKKDEYISTLDDISLWLDSKLSVNNNNKEKSKNKDFLKTKSKYTISILIEKLKKLIIFRATSIKRSKRDKSCRLEKHS